MNIADMNIISIDTIVNELPANERGEDDLLLDHYYHRLSYGSAHDTMKLFIEGGGLASGDGLLRLAAIIAVITYHSYYEDSAVFEAEDVCSQTYMHIMEHPAVVRIPDAANKAGYLYRCISNEVLRAIRVLKGRSISGADSLDDAAYKEREGDMYELAEDERLNDFILTSENRLLVNAMLRELSCIELYGLLSDGACWTLDEAVSQARASMNAAFWALKNDISELYGFSIDYERFRSFGSPRWLDKELPRAEAKRCITHARNRARGKLARYRGCF